MELYSASRLKRTPPSAVPAERYLERLPLRPDRRRQLLERASAAGGNDAHAVMAELHRALAGEMARQANPAYGSAFARMRLFFASGVPGSTPPVVRTVEGHPRLATTPPLARSSMAPNPWRRHRRSGLFRARTGGCPDVRPDPAWQHAGTARRMLLATVSISQTALAVVCMSAVLPYHGARPLEVALLSLFALLFGWVSAGFWTALMGFLVQLLGRDRYAISASAAADAPIAESARTAIVMPIANEDVQRVFAGLRATYESLVRTGEAEHFDFFVLSDSGDPDVRVAETQAWLDLCRELRAFGRVFYRWRQHRIKRKSGNVGDFCRRWGSKYRYMVVLDADSVMSGECLVTLARLMEANPNAGIIQTAPRAAGRESLFARVQQFANRVYGPLFTAGLHAWQLGESHYWGHNAIIRVEPFIRHCALGRLPGKGTLSGEILSHDFVEAALMRRAGWGVWIAYDLPGSYEEMPPNLVDELKRDRRWCHGNLINSRLVFGEGLHPAHRVVFMTGVMAYFSAPLWFLFLLLSTVLLAVHTLVPPQYFVSPNQLFPLWPEWHEGWAVALSAFTGMLLFLPKILSVVLIACKHASEFGSMLRLAAGAAIESVFSALLAPIRMLFHTQFVLTSLLGWQVHWKSPPRDDAETSWGEAFRRHGWHSVFGIAWAALVHWLNPSYLWWLAPVVGALALSIPISVVSSRISAGRRFRSAGLFGIPEETRPPAELERLKKLLLRPDPPPGWIDAVVDPAVNALACASGVARVRLPAEARARRLELVERALVGGPQALGERETNILLGDPVALSSLHFAAWTSAQAHPLWVEARRIRSAGDNVIVLPSDRRRPASRRNAAALRAPAAPRDEPRPPVN